MLPLFRTLRFRLLLLVGLALLPAAALVLINAAEERASARRTTAERALLITRVAASDYALYVESTRDLLTAIGQEVIASPAGSCEAGLARQVETIAFYSNLAAFNRHGALLCSASPTSDAFGEAERMVSHQAIESRSLTAGRFQTDGDGRPILPIGFPIIDPSGVVQGAVVANLDLMAISHSLAPAQLPAGAVFSVLDRDGTVVVHDPDPERWIGRTVGDGNLLHAVRARSPATVEAVDPDSVRRLSGVYPLSGPWTEGTVVVGIPTDLAYAPANERLVQNMLSLAVVAAIALTAVWIGGDVLLVRRVRALIATTRQLAGGDLSARSGLTSDQGELGALAGAVDEMAQALQQRDAQLTHQAFHDPVTELPNRAWFLQRLRTVLDRPSRSGGRVAVLFVDLDNFKVINDSLGHAAGDHLLTSLGNRLSHCLDAGESIARFGGDEFAVLSEHIGGEAEAYRLAGRLLAELRRPLLVDGREIVVTASVGIAAGTPPAADLATLLRHADIAMYQAKLAGRDRAVLFDDEMQRAAMERLELETDLRHAIDRGQMERLLAGGRGSCSDPACTASVRALPAVAIGSGTIR